jgi:hypothetical protein
VDCATNTARKAGVPKKVAPPRRKLGASDAAAAAAVDAAAVLRQEMAAAGAAESNAAARARELATSLQAASAEAEALKATLVSKGSQVALLGAAVAEQRQQHEAEAKALQRQAEWERTRAEEKAAANESSKLQDLTKRLHETETQLRLVSMERNVLASNLRKMEEDRLSRLLQVQGGGRRRPSAADDQSGGGGGGVAGRGGGDSGGTGVDADAADVSAGRRHGAISWVTAPPSTSEPRETCAVSGSGSGASNNEDCDPDGSGEDKLMALAWTSAQTARRLLEISGSLLGNDDSD